MFLSRRRQTTEFLSSKKDELTVSLYTVKLSFWETVPTHTWTRRICMAMSHDLLNTLHYQSFIFDKQRTQKPCLIFVSLYLPDYQQGWTSCVSICHMYFCFCKLPVSIYLRCYSRGWAFGVFLWLLCRDSLATMEINHLSTFMLQIFLPRLSLVFRLGSGHMLFPQAHNISEAGRSTLKQRGWG